jgi:hypothetical protein
VKNGRFEQRVLLPKSVPQDKPGVKLTAYAWEGASVALGSKNDLMFYGFDTTNVADTTGPNISVRPVYEKGSASVSDTAAAKGAYYTDKISGPLPMTLEVMVSDSNGIDVVSLGPDEGLTFEVPGIVPRKNINQKFTFSAGDFRKGTASIGLSAGQMTPGSYTMVMSAQDLLGNVSHRTIPIEVTTQQELALYHVFNYPNPMRMRETCKFYYDLSKTVTQTEAERVLVTIRIFTLSGRLVRVFKDAKRGQVFDGTDNLGNRLSPGVYLYQVTAEDKIQQKVVKSGIEKLAINPPR